MNAQNLVNHRAWIRVLNTAYETEENKEDFTGNSAFNTLLEQHNVTVYKQALPFAKTPLLQEYYEIECSGCDLSNLNATLLNNYSNDFADFAKDQLVTNVGFYDPTDIYWQDLKNGSNDYLWYLEKIEADKAWDITRGDTAVKVAVIDDNFDLQHEDLASEVLSATDPYDNTSYPCTTSFSHGNGVAVLVSGETTEIGGQVAGRSASIGFNTKIYLYQSPRFSVAGFLRKALHASNVMNVRVLVSCFGAGVSCDPYTSLPAEPVVNEILDNGTTVITPAGNGPRGNRCPPGATSLVSKPSYPFHPSFDDRIIIVSSTGKDDKHYYFDPTTNQERTHSHFPEVDLCAPGYEITTARQTNCTTSNLYWPYATGNGTSFAAPIVAGTASLLYSINPCLSTTEVKSILKNTTDSIVDADSFPGLIGTGRLNAYHAVQRAQAAKSNAVDLYIRDRVDDVGISGGYSWQATRDNSPDIWVRNQNDGLSNTQHQDPEYQNSMPVYVYVRVRNKSCVSSAAQETLKLYWSKASTWSSWPQNWNGSQVLIGNVIDSIVVPPLAPGKDTILEFVWNILNPNIHNNWASCLLARIEGSAIDPITVYPGRIDDDVFFNNNIAMKNISILDDVFGIVPTEINGVLHPPGRYVFIGNAGDTEEEFDLVFSEKSENYTTTSLSEDAEINLFMDESGWSLLLDAVENTEGIEILNEEERSFKITQKEVILEGISFPENTRVPLYVGFSFLVDEATERKQYAYKVEQKKSAGGHLLGGEQFEITSKIHSTFYADAGPDRQIKQGESATLQAVIINEPAQYRWYNENNELTGEGASVDVTPLQSSEYTLEVISKSNGYKDYDKVKVQVQHNWLENMNPNPANNQVSIDYYIGGSPTTVELMILNQSATTAQIYVVNTTSGNALINLSNYPSGAYTVILLINGIAEDTQTLIVQ